MDSAPAKTRAVSNPGKGRKTPKTVNDSKNKSSSTDGPASNQNGIHSSEQTKTHASDPDHPMEEAVTPVATKVATTTSNEDVDLDISSKEIDDFDMDKTNQPAKSSRSSSPRLILLLI